MKKYTAALECFNCALDINPTFDKSIYNKGNTLNILKDYAAALECFKRALEIKS